MYLHAHLHPHTADVDLVDPTKEAGFCGAPLPVVHGGGAVFYHRAGTTRTTVLKLAQRHQRRNRAPGRRSDLPSRFSQRSIILRLAQKTFVTEPDGRFAIRDIPTGAHRLQLHAIGFEPIQLPLTIKRRKTLVLAPLGLKASRGLVSGRLIDAQQRSLDNLPVRLHPKEITVLTDRDGIFTFRRVPAGSYALVVGNDQQNQTIARRFHLEAGQQFNLGLVSLAPAPPPLASPALSSRFSLLLLASSPPSDSSSAAPASSASSVWLSGIR